MFSKHVTKNLSAYVHGELAQPEAQELAEHLIACGRCRAQFEEIKVGIKLAEQLPKIPAPESIWPELDRRWSPQAPPARALKTNPFGILKPRFVGITAVMLLSIALGVYFLSRDSSRPSWDVFRLDGKPQIGSLTIGGKGKLGVGQWLVTDGSSRAQIAVGSIGHVEIDPNTRVRLLQTAPTEHRLELAQGRLSARIWAPPRLFFVDTPSAVAADLGCAYTLEVDEKGSSLLHVTSGWVALQLKDRESMVPAGAACQTRPGIGPGTPYFEDASTAFRSALSSFDFEHDSKTPITLQTILNEARPRDSLTIWHLLFRVQGADRRQVYERLAFLSPPPAGVSSDGVMQLNQAMLDSWKDDLAKTWNGSSPGKMEKTLKGFWTSGLGKVKGLEGKR